MTQQVKEAYRKNRRATFFVVLAVIVAAAIAIPFASGARPTTYTFTGDQAFCAGATSVTFDVELKNTSKTQNLGSADLYAPANIDVTNATASSGSADLTDASGTYAGRSLISLRNMTVAANGGIVTISVTADITGTGPEPWYSIAKQANEFNPGDLNTSNSFTNEGSDPTVTVSTCELRFAQEPPAQWQKGLTTSPPVEVALFAGTTRVLASGPLGLTATGPSTDFSGLEPVPYDTTSRSWKFPAAMPNTSATSGRYTLSATGFGSTATSREFEVADAVCLPGVSCLSFYNTGGEGSAGSDVSAGFTVSLNYAEGGDPQCTPTTEDGGTWNQAYYVVGGDAITFPSVSLSYSWGDDVLQLKYYIPNDQWTQTQTSRGNSDIEFCFEGVHELTSNLPVYAFPVKEGFSEPAPLPSTDTQAPGYAVCRNTDNDADCELFYGVLPTVPNPNKVKAGGDPAVCARGNEDIGGVTYRTWTICIPRDWDPRTYP